MTPQSVPTTRTFRRITALVMLCVWLTHGLAWGINQPPLSRIPVPEPANLSQFVKDKQAAIRLGKALFWDMQVGSDGGTACASCHYRAGADPITGTLPKGTARRNKNQLHPGKDSIFGNNSTVLKTPDAVTGLPVTVRAEGLPWFTPNYLLVPTDFPLFRPNPINARLVIDPLTGLTNDPLIGLRDTNDIVGSQGVRLADFLAINNAPQAQDSGTPLADQIFHISPVLPNPDPANNVRQVTGRNSPSVINSVFNFTNFWDGRANNIFNGVSPFGPLDQTAGIWIDNGTILEKQKIAIANASLASQAVGPPLNEVEMSFKGRTFPELGRKLLALRPLDLQQVHPNDSVLGGLSRATLNGDGSLGGNRGLTSDYRTMIEAAFVDSFWNSNRTVDLNTVQGLQSFSQMEANFSLFWGLAIQLYEATLVSDRAPFDLFQAGNQNALNAAAQRGFTTFDSKCAVCHSGSEFSAAVTGSTIPVAFPDSNPVAFTNNSSHRLISPNQNQATLAVGLSDTGFFNIGVRDTGDDLGRAGTAPSGLPLSFSRLVALREQGTLPFATPKLPPFAIIQQTDMVNGTFKTPGLRNVELTAPYFHNGSALTLGDVLEFYSRGGNFPSNPELAAAMQPIGNLRKDPVGQAEVVEFLKSLTDERVRNETAPFDHPELIIPNGDLPDIILAATGGGPAPVNPVLTMTPLITPTSQAIQVLGGTVDDGTVPMLSTVAVNINGVPSAATVSGTTWSLTTIALPLGNNTISVTASSLSGGTTTLAPVIINIRPSATIAGVPSFVTKFNSASPTVAGTGVVSYQYKVDNGAYSADIPVNTPITLNALADGTHTISVLGCDGPVCNGIQGNQQPATTPTTAIWIIKATPPLLTLNPLNTPTGNSTQTIGGTVELGTIPSVAVTGGAVAGPVRFVPGIGQSTWSCDISSLSAGTSTVTVTAQDSAFNTTTASGVITRILRDGNFKGTGITDISDALKALRFAVGLEQPTAIDMIHGDLAPLVNGQPTQDESIDIADALLILRKTVGLVTF